MQAVGPIDVERSGWPEHGPVARRAAPVGVARRIIGPGVRFDLRECHLGDGAAELGPDPATEQAPGHIEDRAGDEVVDWLAPQGSVSGPGQVQQERLESVHAILGLVEHEGAFVLDDLVGQLLVPMCR